MIESYMKNYWAKYPQEKENDPSLEEIVNFDGETYVGEFLLIQYKHYDIGYVIHFYCYDGLHKSFAEIRRAKKEHKNFVKSLDDRVFVGGVKELFSKRSMFKYIEELDMLEVI